MTLDHAFIQSAIRQSYEAVEIYKNQIAMYEKYLAEEGPNTRRLRAKESLLDLIKSEEETRASWERLLPLYPPEPPKLSIVK